MITNAVASETVVRLSIQLGGPGLFAGILLVVFIVLFWVIREDLKR